jgi:transcriptional regulator with XRE-family HTH domain
LADFACVSVSTIERVECGEKVSNEALDRIAQGLGYEPGRFTAPRYRLGPEQAAGPAYGAAFGCATFRAAGNSLSLGRDRRGEEP